MNVRIFFSSSVPTEKDTLSHHCHVKIATMFSCVSSIIQFTDKSTQVETDYIRHTKAWPFVPIFVLQSRPNRRRPTNRATKECQQEQSKTINKRSHKDIVGATPTLLFPKEQTGPAQTCEQARARVGTGEGAAQARAASYGWRVRAATEEDGGAIEAMLALTASPDKEGQSNLQSHQSARRIKQTSSNFNRIEEQW